MKTKSLTNILITLIAFLFLSNCHLQTDTDVIEETAGDNYRQDFWLESETALGEEYLIKVWLPGSYFTSTKKYPVLYLTDADWLFGIASDIAYHLELNSREIILVGIAYGSQGINWEKRQMDFLADHFNEKGTPGYALFLSFLKDELIPLIESRFRAESTNRTLFGWSLGFHFACHTLYEQRTLFDNYIIGGGLFPENWPEQLKLKDREHLRQEKSNTPICIYVGNPESDASPEQFQTAIQWLEKQNFADFLLEWEIYDGMGHTIPAAAEVIINGMEYIYNKKSIVSVLLKVIDSKGVDAAIADYKRWKEIRPELSDYNPGELKQVAEKLRQQNKILKQSELQTLIDKEYPKKQIEIVVVSKALPPSSTIYITGNHEELANWNPSAVPLTKKPDGSWSGIVLIEESSHLEYKITLGSWETEALDKDREVLSNFTLDVQGDTLISIEINNWKGI